MKQRINKPAPGRSVTSTAVCAEPELLAKAKARAKAQRRSLSAYVALLIERDLEKDEIKD